MKRLTTIFLTAISRRWLLPTIIVLLGMGVLARLGIWQLDRLEQRRAANAELRQVLESPPLELTGDRSLGDSEILNEREVTVRGHYDFSHQVVLKLQNWEGRTGVHLVTPLLLDRGESAVLVDRGWIPETEAVAASLADYDEPGLVTVKGYVALSQRLATPADESLEVEPQDEWYRVDIDGIQRQMPYPLLPVYVRQAPAPEGDKEPPFRSEREIDLSDGPHLGYAVQWFIFTFLLLAIYLAYLDRRTSG